MNEYGISIGTFVPAALYAAYFLQPRLSGWLIRKRAEGLRRLTEARERYAAEKGQREKIAAEKREHLQLLQKLAAEAKERERTQIEYWRQLSGLQFETELGQLFHRLGYKVLKTPPTGDGGVDLILHKDGLKTVIQCKRYKTKVAIGVAREMAASMHDFQAQHAIIACVNGVTRPVREYAAKRQIRILDARDIVALQTGGQ